MKNLYLISNALTLTLITGFYKILKFSMTIVYDEDDT